MGWTFPWYSSQAGDFNFDHRVSFTPEQVESGDAAYNDRQAKVLDELPGVSVFCRDEAEDLYHTYSAYSRGLDMLDSAYHYMDPLPKGRDESELPWTMAWLRRHDQYEDQRRQPLVDVDVRRVMRKPRRGCTRDQPSGRTQLRPGDCGVRDIRRCCQRAEFCGYTVSFPLSS